jgi:alkylhydroperoxidase family enzyme
MKMRKTHIGKCALIALALTGLSGTPHAMSQSDADAVYAAGWSERALHDAILVTSRFNYMNRLTLGHGLDPQAEDAEDRARRMSYAQPPSS